MPDITIETDGEKVNPEELIAEIVEKIDETSEQPDSAADVASELVPIFLFFAVAVTYCFKYFFAHRAKQDVQKTVRAALERGDPMTSQLLDRLVEQPAPKRNDLRRGVISIGLGVGLAAFGFIVGDEDAVRPMIAVGFVPLLLGVAYLALWRLDRNGKTG